MSFSSGVMAVIFSGGIAGGQFWGAYGVFGLSKTVQTRPCFHDGAVEQRIHGGADS
jgi:hypothetical protein